MIAPRRRTGGALAAIAGLLLVSGAIRAGLQLDVALAEARGGEPAGDHAAAGDPGGEAGPAGDQATGDDTASAGTGPEGCVAPPDDVAAVIRALTAREARVAAREAALDQRMSALSLAEAEFQEMQAELIAAEEELRSLVAFADTAAETDLARLTEVYENMEPDEASALFQQMTPEFAAGFLGRMRPEIAAAVLARLEPETAYTISVILAGRNAGIPRN